MVNLNLSLLRERSSTTALVAAEHVSEMPSRAGYCLSLSQVIDINCPSPTSSVLSLDIGLGDGCLSGISRCRLAQTHRSCMMTIEAVFSLRHRRLQRGI